VEAAEYGPGAVNPVDKAVMQPEPNIYVCSTVRHLLFALLRADLHRSEQHHILFFADYQHASLADWQLGSLPANIVVREMSRGSVRRYMDDSARGKLCYFFAMRNWQAPASLLAPLRTLLADQAPQLATALDAAQAAGRQPRLWLFNERNRMARLLRLLIPRFALIEDGESNYRLQLCVWWKWPGRLLQGYPPRSRVLGEEAACETIHALTPERLPERIRDKGRRIDFLEHDSARALMDRIFSGLATIPRHAGQIILATQPFRIPGVTLADKQRVYDRIIAHLQALGRPVVLKNHPAEDAGDYAFLGDRVIRMPGKLPLEVMLPGNSEPLIIVSVFSTAGMGFERYCRRVRLCAESDSDALYLQTVRAWIAEPRKLEEVLQEKLTA
jgi:Alpha-2,8-polysialyltransferase (POLYST)